MEFVYSFIDQANKDAIYYQSDIFLAYCALNNFLNNNNRKLEDIEDDSRYFVEKHMDNQDEFKDITDLLMSEMKRLLSFNKLNFLNKFDGVIFLIGDTSIDSHGMIVDNKSYLLIDVLNYYMNRDKYNPISFLIHELVHPVHYKANKDMYFENYQSNIEKVTKRMILEGMATFFTRLLCEESDSDVFWLGYLEASDVKKWIEYAERNKNSTGTELNVCIENDQYDEALGITLFSISDPDKLWAGRIAYYYGYKIISIIYETYTIEDILLMDYDHFMPYILAYFNL